jgi:hypothetical protein
MNINIPNWGWDGGCALDPGHLAKAKASDMQSMRLHVYGHTVCPSKNNEPNFDLIPEGDGNIGQKNLRKWNDLGVKILLNTSWHPPDLNDDEIVHRNRSVFCPYHSAKLGEYSIR